MSMQEVKAFVHRNRIADVVDALSSAGFRHLSIIDVQGLLRALDNKEQQYSIEIGRKVVTEVKLEVVCENKSRTTEAISLIREHAKTGQPDAGWIYVSEIQGAVEISD